MLFRSYRQQLSKCPTFEQVVAKPEEAALPSPDHVGILYALGESFVHRLLDPSQAERGLSPEVNPKQTAAVAKYFHRAQTQNPACREAVAWFFRVAGAKVPSLAGLPEYKALVH